MQEILYIEKPSGRMEQDPGNERMLARYNRFFERVRDYYLAGKDQKMLKSIETGIWVL